jgi:hypothetical protein
MSYNMMIGYDIYDSVTMNHFRLRQTMTLTTKMCCSRLYLLYLVLAVGAKVQLKNIMMILTSTSCSHVQKDDSFLPGSSG